MKQRLLKFGLCVCLLAMAAGTGILLQAAVTKAEEKTSSGKKAEDVKKDQDSSQGSAIHSAKETLFEDLFSQTPSTDGTAYEGQDELTEAETAGEEPAVTEDPEETVPPEEKEAVVLPEDGTLSVPDHPVTMTTDRMVFIGDSRTVDMMNAVHDDSVWACKVSMGYQWMATEAVPAVEGYIDAGTAVIILMGVNDVYNISNYIGYTNQKAAEWAAKGATTYYVSVGPVTSDPYVTNAEIESFNAALQANLSGVYYIDIYTYLTENGFSTVDGTHYPDNVSIAIYNYIIENLEENRDGLW